MKTKTTIVILIMCLTFASRIFGADLPGKVDKSKLEWEQSPDTLALKHGDRIIWQFNTRNIDTKPCFHPLRTFKGTTLTNWRPKTDHPWHRAAWFSFKKIDGRVYWEEDKETGKTKWAQTILRGKKLTRNSDFSAQIDLEMAYSPREGQPPSMLEHRKITVSAPDEHGDYEITSTHRFEAQKDLTINKNWYGGFALRLGAELKEWTFINQQGDRLDTASFSKERKKMAAARKSGAKNVPNVMVSPASPWMCFVESASGPTQGIAVFDAADNLNHPPPWACIPPMPYMNPVFFGNDDVKMKKGETLELKYRILVFNEQNPVDYLPAKYQTFNNEKQ